MATLALATSTPVCPRRSTSRPSGGPPTPSAIAKAPVTAPAAAKEPVSRWVWTSSAMLSIPSGGSRATTEAANRRPALEEKAIDFMSRCQVLTV